MQSSTVLQRPGPLVLESGTKPKWTIRRQGTASTSPGEGPVSSVSSERRNSLQGLRGMEWSLTGPMGRTTAPCKALE